MYKFLKKSGTWALSAITIIFTFVPENTFEKLKLMSDATDEANVILTRVLAFVIVLSLSIIVNALYLSLRRKVRIKGKNYSIQVEYGDILKMSGCKKVVTFDECFTTSVGSHPSEVKPDSICGQYLQNYPIRDMQSLIDNAQLHPLKSKSQYQSKKRYCSGVLISNGEFLLMAFAKLDKDGLGRFFSHDEFLDCLSTLWKEIDKHYGQKDVCIPVLGSGITRMDGSSLTQQELLDIIIDSYRISANKMKMPYKLHIVCKKRDDFSLNRIGQYA